MESMHTIEEFFAEHEDLIRSVDAIIGTSLGGFYARYLANKYTKELVMINPALEFYGNEDRFHLSPDVPASLIVCLDDETINPHKGSVYKHCKLIEGSDSRLP